MKANAPERLYLSKTIYSTYLYQVPDPDDETAVEYIRKDAFIEKAAEWLDNFYNEDTNSYLIDEDIPCFACQRAQGEDPVGEAAGSHEAYR